MSALARARLLVTRLILGLALFCTLAFPVVAQDLVLSKTTASTFIQGGTASYSLTVSNVGGAPTTANFSVADTMPTGLTIASISASAPWSCAALTSTQLSCTRSTALAANASAPSITVAVNIAANAPASITNTATVSGGGETVTNNNSASSTVSVTAAAPDLTITKSAQGSGFQQGGTITYLLTVTNGGNGPTTGTITVLDSIPTGLTVTSVSGTNWICTNAQPVSCTRTTPIAAGTNSVITLAANIASNAAASITNTANVSTPGESNAANNAGSSVISVAAVAPDLTITKSTQGSGFQQGGTITYLLTVTNGGNGPTTGTITMTDTIPTGLTVTSATGTNWTCTTGTTVSCTRTTPIAAGTNSVITLAANIASNAAASITNTATVAGGGELVTNNNAGTAFISVGAAAPDLTISKTTPSSFAQGGTASYTLIVNNIGTVVTSGAYTVTDTLPTGLTLASTPVGTGWNCAASTSTVASCTRSATIPAGVSATAITLAVNIASNAPASVTNTATVSGGGEAVTNNNSSSNTVSVIAVAPDLTINKATSSAFQRGGTAIYTFTVNNIGNGATSAGYSISDNLPAGLTINAILVSGGWDCGPSTDTVLSCSRNTAIPSGASSPVVTLTVNIAANAPASVTNTATVSGGGETVTNNNSSLVTSAITFPPPPALVSVVSQQFQNGIFYNLPIDFLQPINGAITVEPRANANGHNLIFQFATPITSVDPVAVVVDANNATVTNAATTASGVFVVVNLGAIPDRQRITVTLTGINGFATVSLSMGFMLGDFNSSRSVDANDITAIKARSGQSNSLSNFMFDVNRTGTISAADISAVKARSVTTLP